MSRDKRQKRKKTHSRGGKNSSSGYKSSADKSKYSDPKRQIKNYQTRLKAAERKVPAYDKSKGKSVLAKTFDKTMDIISRPQQAVVLGGKNLLDNDKKTTFGQGFKQGITGKQHYYGNEVMKDLGVKSKAGQLIGGIAFDTATDPFTFMTGGIGQLLKGVTTGKKAVRTMNVADEVIKVNKLRAVKGAEQEMLRHYGVKTRAGLGKKFDLASDAVDDEIERYAFAKHTKMSPTDDKVKLEKAFASKVIEADKKARKVKSGKGVSVLGKTIVGGDTMQDIGANVSNAVLRRTGPVGRGVDNVRDTAKSMFDANKIGQAGNEVEDVYKKIANAAKGKKNYADSIVYQQVKDLDTLTRGMKYFGQPLDNKIDDFISMGKDGLSSSDLHTTIANTSSKRAAATRLGLNADATLDDVIERYKKFYGDFATDETNAGLLRNIKENYAPRVKSDSNPVRGGMNQYGRVNNAFAKERNVKYDNRPIAEINAIVRDKNGLPQDFNLFEESAVKTFATRAMSHNKIMADKQFVDEVLGTYGKAVTDTEQMYQLWNNGYDIIIPRDKLKVYRIKDAAEINDGKVPKVLQDAAEMAMSFDGEPMRVLQQDAALALLGTPDGKKVMTALPNGMAAEFNKAAKLQQDESMQGLKALVKSFNSVWKPLVTSLNINFHRRNLVSASFNNFLDLGARMFNPDTQLMAAEVMKRGAGGAGRITTKIRGKVYSADDIYRLMVENNALGSFGMSDADDLTKGIVGEVRRSLDGKNPFQAVEGLGRAVGNRTEEYVRATNFIAHMKQGLDPQDAAEMVRKFHFDYTDLTEMERNFKLAMPFYTWLRKNFPLQLEKFLDNPSPYMAVSRAGQEGANMVGIEYDDMPDYLQETGAIPYDRVMVNGKPTGRVKVLDAGLPIADLKTGGRDIMSMMSPLIKALPELVMNQSFMTGAPLYKTDKSAAIKLGTTGDGMIDNAIQQIKGSDEFLENNPKLAKMLDYALNNSGFISNLNKYGSTADTSNKVLQNPYDRYPTKYKFKNEEFDKYAKDKESVSAIINALRGVTDPRMTKYFSPKIAKKNQIYEYQRQLADLVQQYKEEGRPVPTLYDLKKEGIIPWDY